MDPQRGNLCEYQAIPIITVSQFQEQAKTHQIVLYHNLIVDYTDFKHPGSFQSIDSNRGRQISSSYDKNEHSFNADIVLCQRTIGRLADSPLQAQGRNFYKRVKNSDINLLHEAILSKCDFSKPLDWNFARLYLQELYILSQIPKFLKNPQKANDMHYNSKWDKFYRKNHALINTALFIACFISFIVFLFLYYPAMQVLSNSYYLLVGFLSWSLIQYLTHRYDFHHDMLKSKLFKGPDIHHCFPNVPQSLVVSVDEVALRLLLYFAISYILFGLLQAILILLGILSGLIMYNILHYCIHCGTEFKIGWLKALSLNHLNHHFKDQHSLYGLTTTLWDHVFRTNKPNKKKYK